MRSDYYAHPYRHTAEGLTIVSDSRGLHVSSCVHGKRATYDVRGHSITGELAPGRATVAADAEATSCRCASSVEIPDGWAGSEVVPWPCRSGGIPLRWMWQDLTDELAAA